MKKLSVEIHNPGCYNEGIFKMITNSNAGIVPHISLLTIQMWVYAEHARIPILFDEPSFEFDGNNTIHIFEGKEGNRKPTLSITEREIVGSIKPDEVVEAKAEDESIHAIEETPTLFVNTRNNLETTHY
jgi:hypothetical protein